MPQTPVNQPVKFTIKFTRCPTNYNQPQFRQTDEPQKLLVFESTQGNQLVLNKSVFGDVVVDEVYTETESEKQVHYKDRGYGKPHISEALLALVPRPKKEVLA